MEGHTMSLRDDLIARGFITPITSPTTAVVKEPLNTYQWQTIALEGHDHEFDPSGADHMVDVYETRFTGIARRWDRETETLVKTDERWTLPPLKNQWQHDWRRRVEAGQPALRLRAPRWAYYGGA